MATESMSFFFASRLFIGGGFTSHSVLLLRVTVYDTNTAIPIALTLSQSGPINHCSPHRVVNSVRQP